MAAPKKVYDMTGDEVTLVEAKSGHPVTPININTLIAAVLQLQATANELITRHNADTTSNPVTGAGAAATDKFTTD